MNIFRLDIISAMNDLIVYGLNYHSCPVAIRERFTIPESCLEHALTGLKRLPHILEAAVLSTCNRTEVYAVVSDVAAGFKELESFFQAARQIADHNVLEADFKLLRDDVALQSFRVAAGLDSMVLGEGQIMSQVKAAHQAALRAGSAGAIIDALFKAALHCGKRVRSQTSLGRRAVSISSAAVELTKKLLGNLHNRRLCVIGAGRMGQICIKLLLADHAQCTVYVANRSESKIKALLSSNLRHLDRLRVVEDFEQRHAIAASCDAVIVATSANGFVLSKSELSAALGSSPLADSASFISDLQVGSKLVHVIDMSVPRTVDPLVGKLPGVVLYNFDDLSAIVKQNMAEREALTREAEIIIFDALKQFEHWQRTLLVGPVIAQLRGKVENIRQSYLRRGARQHSDKQLDKVSRVIVNQILHQPTTKLKAKQDKQSLQKQVETLRSLFDLDPLAKAK